MSDEQTMPNEAQGPEGAAIPDVGVDDVLRFALSLFGEQAWIHLGLRSRPNGEAQEDLAQAKVAIDAFGALAQLTEGRFDPHDVRDLKNMLSSLQMNYVQRKNA